MGEDAYKSTANLRYGQQFNSALERRLLHVSIVAVPSEAKIFPEETSGMDTRECLHQLHRHREWGRDWRPQNSNIVQNSPANRLWKLQIGNVFCGLPPTKNEDFTWFNPLNSIRPTNAEWNTERCIRARQNTPSWFMYTDYRIYMYIITIQE